MTRLRSEILSTRLPLLLAALLLLIPGIARADDGSGPEPVPQVEGRYVEARVRGSELANLLSDARLSVAATAGQERAILCWAIERGRWDGVDLAGRSIAAVTDSRGPLLSRRDRAAPRTTLWIDERASDEEKRALISLAEALAPRVISAESVQRLTRARIRWSPAPSSASEDGDASDEDGDASDEDGDATEHDADDHDHDHDHDAAAHDNDDEARGGPVVTIGDRYRIRAITAEHLHAGDDHTICGPVCGGADSRPDALSRFVSTDVAASRGTFHATGRAAAAVGRDAGELRLPGDDRSVLVGRFGI